MTKSEIEEIIKRYAYIEKAIQEKQAQAVFYVGNRKHIVEISEEVKIVMEIVDEVYQIEAEAWIKNMIKGITTGKTDVNLIIFSPIEKNGYYIRKRRFVEKVYKCCIAKNIVPYEEVVKETIA